MNTSKKYTYNSSRKKHINKPAYSKYWGIPIILILAVVPLIMYLYTYPMNLSKYLWASLDEYNADIFLYFKQVIFLVISSIMLLLVLFKLKNEITAIKKMYLFIPMFIYGILNFLSTIFSKTSNYGFNGIFDQFESTFTILAYCIIILYCFIYIKNEETMNYIIKYFMIGIVVIVLIGLLQYSGHDFLMTDVGKKLYLPKSEWGNLDTYTMTFEKNRVFLTLFNPNYVGIYVSMVIPFIACLLICVNTIKHKIIYGMLLLGLIIVLVGSGSKTSLICILLTLPFMLFFFRKKIAINKKITSIIAVILSLAVIFLGLTKIEFIKNTINSVTNIEKSNNNITNIETSNILAITYKGNSFKVNFSNESAQYNINVTDINNSMLDSHVLDDGQLIIDDTRFQGISVRIGQYEGINAIQLNIDGELWNFSNQLGDGTFYYLNKYGRFDKIKNAESAVFTNYESFASGRGYIWSRSIPLVLDHIVLGSGANSYAFVFPQNDYLGFYNAGLGTDLLTKPHSFFLQTAIQSGLISLIAFLVFYIIYFIWSVRLYLKSDFESIFSHVGIGVLMASIGFMIAGITNDSSICTTPIFWALMGLGITSNINIQKVN